MSPAPADRRLLRASDAERHEAVLALSEHYASGRLDHEEFERRMTAASGATYVADLEPLFDDLPHPRGGAAPTPPPPVLWAASHRGHRPPLFLLLLTAFLVVSLVAHGFSWWLLIPTWMLVSLVSRRLARRRSGGERRPAHLGAWYAAAGPGHRPPWSC